MLVGCCWLLLGVRGFDERLMRRLLGIGDGPEVILGGDKDGAKRRDSRVMGRLQGTGNRW